MNVKYKTKDLLAVTKENNKVDLAELIENSDLEMTDENLKKISERLPASMQNSHSNICSTQMGQDGKMTISIGRHLDDMADTMLGVAKSEKRQIADVIIDENNVNYLEGGSTNPSLLFDIFEIEDNNSAVQALVTKEKFPNAEKWTITIISDLMTTLRFSPTRPIRHLCLPLYLPLLMCIPTPSLRMSLPAI